MSIIQKVTLTCMRQNKKRTMVTIIGVIICVAMITAVCILANSFRDAFIRSTIENTGSYEFMYYVADQDKNDQIHNDPVFETVMRVGELGGTDASQFGITNKNRTGVTIQAIDAENAKLAAIHLIEGNMPSNKDEIVISNEMLEAEGFSVRIGDQITMPIYQYDEEGIPLESSKVLRTFTLTGVVRCDNLQNQSYRYLVFTNYQEVKQVLATYVTFKDKSDLINANLDAIARYDIPRDYVSVNYSLQLYQGTVTDTVSKTMMSVCIILFMIILIGGVSLIYNAFSISLSERSRYLGMLSSIGATQRQKCNSVFFEAFLIGVIAIPIGILSGIFGLAVTFQFINPYLTTVFATANNTSAIGLHVLVNPSIIIFIIIFSTLILLLSAWIPAFRASKITAIRAIRQNADIKVKKRHLKTSKLTLRLFGIEGVLALKNIKRYRSRYLSNICSLIICVVLFMSSSYFSSSLKKSVDMASRNTNADIIVNLYVADSSDEEEMIPDSKDNAEDLLDALLNIPSAASSVYYVDTNLLLSDSVKITDQAKHYLQEENGFSDEEMINFDYYVRLQMLDDKSFADYCKKIGSSLDDFNQDLPSAILIEQNTIRKEGSKTFEQVHWLDEKQGNQIALYSYSEIYEQEELRKRDNVKLNIAKATNERPDIYYNENEFIMIMNKANMVRLNDAFIVDGQNNIMKESMYEVQFTSNNPAKTYDELLELLNAHTDVAGHVQNLSNDRLVNQQRNLLVDVLLYGFITLISLVCVANIINTISTSIKLRKREFAMIKSVGITPQKFNNMVRFETLIYGYKACLYGIPIGSLIIFWLYYNFNMAFSTKFDYPWSSTLILIVVLFSVLGCTMMYAVHKIKKDNIVETIRRESI